MAVEPTRPQKKKARSGAAKRREREAGAAVKAARAVPPAVALAEACREAAAMEAAWEAAATVAKVDAASDAATSEGVAARKAGRARRGEKARARNAERDATRDATKAAGGGGGDDGDDGDGGGGDDDGAPCGGEAAADLARLAETLARHLSRGGEPRSRGDGVLPPRARALPPYADDAESVVSAYAPSEASSMAFSKASGASRARRRKKGAPPAGFVAVAQSGQMRWVPRYRAH
eukprot:1625919-Prymnesium_polylepis.1